MSSFATPSIIAGVAGVIGLAYLVNKGNAVLQKYITALPDLAETGGLASPVDKKVKNKGANHAVVIGGSWAGLLAARVLLDHIDSVTIIEAEAFGGEDGVYTFQSKRSKIMQYGNPHALLTLGLRIVERLVPGFSERMISFDGKPFDYVEDSNFFSFGGKIASTAGPSCPSISASRGVYENALRLQLLEQHGVRGSGRITYIDNAVVRELKLSDDGQRVVGAVYYSSAERREKEVEAGIVIDASGRSGEGLKLLRKSGAEVPPADSYDPLIAYSGVQVADTQESLDKSKIFNFVAGDARYSPRTGIVLQRIEGGKCQYGYMSVSSVDNPPRTAEEMYETIKDDTTNGNNHRDAAECFEHNGEIVREFRAARLGPSRFLRFDKVKIPAGFFSVGDALACVNPIYGQGLTMAAVCASTLDAALRQTKTLAATSRLYASMITARLTLFWLVPLCLDSQYESVKTYPGAPLWLCRIMAFAILNLSRAAREQDAEIIKVFWKTLCNIIWPMELLSPKVVYSLLKAHVVYDVLKLRH
ncbi:hypothetical protein HDU96_001489 [Phlyctochytrium bullatum]|nr:hypothetical protein HDU96_001489 [Phlyctochytrium bullatum]